MDKNADPAHHDGQKPLAKVGDVRESQEARSQKAIVTGDRASTLRGLADQVEELCRSHPQWSRVHHTVLVLTGYINAIARISDVDQSEALSHQVLEFDYINYKGQDERRRVRPLTVRWGTSDWYHTPQWLLSCWDLDRDDIREFALEKIKNVKQQDHV